jgi:hypothetical protein
MRLLVNGCSFSRGPTAWANHLAQELSADLVNLAQAGAGNTYIAQTTQSELAQRKYDLVIVMWSGLERIDLQVERIQDFVETRYTSLYQSSQNDWAEKIVNPVNDQDYVQKDWVFGVGHLNKDKFLLNNGLFTKQYLYQGLDQHIQRSMYHMISLQSYLEVHNISYVFAFYQNYVQLLQRHPHLLAQLDKDNWYNTTNLFDIAKQTNDYDADGFHPGPTAHRQWAQLLHQFIVK